LAAFFLPDIFVLLFLAYYIIFGHFRDLSGEEYVGIVGILNNDQKQFDHVLQIAKRDIFGGDFSLLCRQKST
jgi:hypothetical protein